MIWYVWIHLRDCGIWFLSPIYSLAVHDMGNIFSKKELRSEENDGVDIELDEVY